MKTVLITGAKGFIAGNIARVLKEAGSTVLGTSRNPGQINNYDEVYCGILGEPLKDVFDKQSIDVVVHCAYDKQELDNINNAEGTRIWAEQAEKSNVGLQIFMSSISSDENALSPYGQKKYELEKWFLAHDQVVFRLGLVVGKGGLFGTIISLVKKSPALPLIDMGKTMIYPSDVDTISNIVCDTIHEKNCVERGRIWHLQQEATIFFVDVLREIRKQHGLFCIFVPVPYFIISIILDLAEKLNLSKFGINTNNIKGMRQVREKNFASDLHLLGYGDTPLDVLIRKTVEK